MENNTIYNNDDYGIQLSSSSGNNRIINNTVTNIGTSYQDYGIYLHTSHNNTITENTANNNNENGIYLEKSNNNTIVNNIDSFNGNLLCGIFLNNSHGNNISWNIAKFNYYGICLNHSNWNYVLNNTFTDNNIDIYNSSDCRGNIFEAGGNGGNGGNGGLDDDDDTVPPDTSDILMIVILVAVGGAIGAIGIIYFMKRSHVEEERSAAITPQEPDKLDIKPKKAVKPKKKPTAVVLPPAELSKEEKKDLEKTEAEMGIEKQKFVCIVHKGHIEGDNYLCPNCQTFYCVKCAKALRDKGEQCWSCGSKIIVAETKTEIQGRIRELESRMDSLKTTVKNLDENFYAGDIDKEEYSKMKDSLTEKISNLVAEIKRLKEESFK